MLEKIRSLILRLFGLKIAAVPDNPDKYVRDYEDIDRENITATIANKLGMLTFADSTCTIDDVGERSKLIAEVVDELFDKGAGIAAQAFGKGGKVFVPFVHNGHIDVQAISQNRMLVRRMDSDKIMDVSIMLDTCVVDTEGYWLIADYTIDANGVQTIRYRACTTSGAEVSLQHVPKWQNVQPEIAIAGTDRALIGFLRCPVDNRKDMHVLGVPITYGAEKSIAELVEHIAIYRREFKLSRMMLGLDASLWRDFGRGKLDADGVTIDDVKRTAQDSDTPFVPVEGGVALDSKAPWQQYAPNIRFEAMEARYNSLLRRVEKDCGLSQGILTERQNVNYANKDEVRAAQYDTFSVIKAMRTAWEKAIKDLAYAVDVLAEFYGLTPGGARDQYEIEYDWDMSMVESSAESFQQLSELQSRGMISKAELRQWVRGGTIEEAQEAIDEINASDEHDNPVDRILQNVEPEGDE
jgi:A118 family predicted phage portal protein